MAEQKSEYRKSLKYNRAYCDDCTRDLTRLKKIYYYFLVFSTIYIEFGYRMVVTNTVSGTIRTIALLLVCVPLVPVLLKFKFNYKPIVLFIYLSCIIFLNVFRDMDYGNYILLFVPLFVGFLISITIDVKHLIHVFSNIIVFLAAFSLLVLAIRIIAPGVIDSLPFLGNVYDSPARMHDAFFSVCIMNSQFLRNYGLTWEPGAFAILLSAAIYCKLTFYKKLNLVNIAILTVALITTFSTMGYFVLAAVYFVSLKRSNNSKKATRIILSIIILLAIVIMVLPETVTDLVFSKLEGLFIGQNSETTQSRLDAIEFPGKAFLSSPFVGVGYEKFSFINKVYCNEVATNTIVNWFAIMGALFGVPCLWCYLGFAKKCSRYVGGGVIGFFILVCAFVLMVSTESLLRISFIYIIVFYGCQKSLFTDKEIIIKRIPRQDDD